MSISGNLLAIYAHPDDESFGSAGTFAQFTDRGGNVTLVCATRGESGEISDSALASPEFLGAVREAELRQAMSHVGVSDIRFLDYRDSGMIGTSENAHPRAFMSADHDTVVAHLLDIMHEVRPAIVLTFGSDGIYGHPDHLKAHFTATAATEAYAQQTDRDAPMLYYNAIPRERIAEMAKRAEGPFSTMSPEELAKLGTPSDQITTVLDVSEQYDRKSAAISAHRTQIGPDGPWADLPPETVREFLSVERYRLVPLSPNGNESDPLLNLIEASRTP